MEPYAQVKFRVLLDGKALAGVSKITALHRETKVIEYREGSDPSATHESPGLTKYSPITLTRGKTQDRDFEDWANQVYRPGGGLGQHIYKTLTLEVLSDTGQVLFAYQALRCWPSSYTALLDLDADAGSMAIEQLKIELEGWERIA